MGALALLAALLRWRRAAAGWGVLAVLWLWVWSTPVVSHGLRHAMESRYPAVPVDDVPQAQAVVVLGGGVAPPEVPGGLPNLHAAADRVWHAARLMRAGKAPWLLVSGGHDPALSAYSEAQAMQGLLVELGVPRQALLLEGHSRNTRQNARYSAQVLQPMGVRRIVLVTSALHMRRAVSLFEAEGFEVIPAATDHEARQRFTALDALPDAEALNGSARALKEWVGQLSGPPAPR